MTSLDRKAAFFHVIDAHRWLAVSGCAWNLVGANAASTVKKAAHQLMPNIDVMVRDCLLLHARSLIKFYRDIRHGQTDIVLSDFGVPAINHHSIEDWRTTSIPLRSTCFTLLIGGMLDIARFTAEGTDATRTRRDWDTEAVSIVALIFETLRWVSQQSVAWQPPFKELYNASTARYRDKSHTWPAILGEKSDVEQYLRSLGL